MRLHERAHMQEYHYCFYDDQVRTAAYTPVSKASISKGDIGGPLLYRQSMSGNIACIIGISSFSIYVPKYQDFVSVFISTTKFREWINSQISYLNHGEFLYGK